jgi:hypothetical protein
MRSPPEDAPASGPAPLRVPDHLDLTIARGELPESLPGCSEPDGWCQIAGGSTMIRFSSGARLQVREGAEATVDLTDMDDVGGDPSWIVQGWAVTIAWLQRGHLSLHAAVMAAGDRTIALAGDRGAGKSTTSMALRDRGYRLLVDDVGLLSLDDPVLVTPFARNVHLLPDAAEALGLDFAALPPLAGGRTKAAYRPEEPSPEPRPLHRIVVLSPTASGTTPSIRQARGAERVAALVPHTARDGLAPRILGPERYFALLTQLADRVPVDVLERPADGWTLPEVLDLIESLA